MKKMIGVLMVLAIAVATVAISAFAGTTNMTVGSTAFASKDASKSFVIENTIAFSSTVSPSGGVVQVLNVPADCVVMFVEYKVLTTNATSVTFDIGDGGSATRWKSNADANTAGAVLGTATPYLYTVADTIDITCDDAITAGTVRVRAYCVDASR